MLQKCQTVGLVEQNPEGVFHDLLPSRSLATSSSRTEQKFCGMLWVGSQVTIHKYPPLPRNNAFRCGTITSVRSAVQELSAVRASRIWVLHNPIALTGKNPKYLRDTLQWGWSVAKGGGNGSPYLYLKSTNWSWEAGAAREKKNMISYSIHIQVGHI